MPKQFRIVRLQMRPKHYREAQGVYVNSAAGAQHGNDAATIRIRGMGTPVAGNDPLFLIDGVLEH